MIYWHWHCFHEIGAKPFFDVEHHGPYLPTKRPIRTVQMEICCKCEKEQRVREIGCSYEFP